eukprot:TRINITY_DN9606_c1_g1_i4.p1 TRINITY_DN9606_c1_g1~~TRINITY_DN9606_c1_g1_i4.p1  ORF type:complete len:474 (+),score=103.87 TRINITY_DN9606_c1_g1_i4:179-1600(+)
MSLVGGLHHKMLAVVAAGGIGAGIYKWSTRDNNLHYISWQHLRSHLLPRGAVLKVNVRDDRCAEIFLSEDKKVLMMVPSIEAFERKLIAEQMQLGVDASNWIEVTHSKAFDAHVLLSLAIMGMWAGVFVWSAGAFRNAAKRGMDGMRNQTTFKVNKADHIHTSFKDVAGLEAPKQEVMEFVSFLKDPERFTKLGAKVPNGVMLMGPPGTGKTLLAKAVAGESKVPFISASGSDFVEMFVGVGPARVRSLFKQARQHGTCIIYIDEIDSLCSARSESGGNDATNRVLTEFLAQMDGLGHGGPDEQLLVLAATNLPWVLDMAIRRRFEKRIYIPLPDRAARRTMFSLGIGDHLTTLQEADWQHLADATDGCSGADISLLCRAALMQGVAKIEDATHFKKIPSTPGDYLLEPCSPGEPTAVAMALDDISEADLPRVTPPVTTIYDFLPFVKSSRSVSEEYLARYEEFTRDFGNEGK